MQEYQNILTPDPKNDFKIEKEMFVRIRRGKYRNDLAVVISVNYDNKTAVCKLVPRIEVSK